MNVGVLANDNPQGLLLAVRLLGRCHVRVSVGGRLGKLLEPGWKLQAEDGKGRIVEIPTRVLRRGDEISTKAEEERSPLDVLWLCDWKDTASGWYSLGECSLLLQCSKATDSKTIAMWLVEVCKEDALIISLQSGLHNARELRSIFGREGGFPVPRNMPLVATQATRKATGSVDTLDDRLSIGNLSRRDSASSIYSEMEGNLEDSIDPSERSASPLPPGALRDLPSPTLSDSGHRNEARKFVRSPLVEEDDDEGHTSDQEDSSRAKQSNLSTHQSSETAGTSALDTSNTTTSAESNQTKLSPNARKPETFILAGVLGFGAAAVADDDTQIVKCIGTHYGAIVLERLTKENSLKILSRVLLLELSGFQVRYRAHEETNNWLWGDVVWRTFEAYGAALKIHAGQDDIPRSMYALLCDKNPIHRRVYAGLLDEALSALRWQKVELMDPVSSPFGLSFRATRSLLLLPRPVFKLCLSIILLLRFPFNARVRDDSPYCDSTTLHRYMAPFLNGEVVRIGFEGEVQTPLNQEILEMLSSATKKQSGNTSSGSSPAKSSGDDAKVQIKTELPPLYSMSFFILVSSCIVLLLAILVRFGMFVIDVTFFW